MLMSFRWIGPKNMIMKRKRSKNGQEVLDRLEKFLSENQSEPVRILCGFWEDQQNVITYQELKEAVQEGFMNEETFQTWAQDYSKLVTGQLFPMWRDSVIAGAVSQPMMESIQDYFMFNPSADGVVDWIKDRGAGLVTNSIDAQREAIDALMLDSVNGMRTVDETAKLIRPCIGLTVGQSKAVSNVYDNAVKSLTKVHPRTSTDKIHQMAMKQATNYAARAHRQRAVTISETEMANAYNFGADESIRQAQNQYLIGKCIKRWNTSGDANVCQRCASLDGMEIEMDDTWFTNKGTQYNDGLFPPLHPRCACAIEYIETEAPQVPAYIQEERERQYGVQYDNVDVDTEYIESEEYKDKFKDITGNRDVDTKIYTCAKKTVEDNDGTKLENMYLIDGDTGETIASIEELKDKIEEGVSYTEEFVRRLNDAIEQQRKVIAVHNHPGGYPPSADDFMKAMENKYVMGIVVGHNGQVYVYKSGTVPLTKDICDSLHETVDLYVRMGYDVDRAYRLVFDSMDLHYEILK